MVITDNESLSAEEKIKQLVEFEEDKRRELDEKKKELEKKKKELEELETRGKIEIEDARKEIEEKIEELALEEKERFEELEEIKRRREAEQGVSLEETISEEEREGRIREAPRTRGYGEALEEVMRGTPTFYDVTNYNVLNRLESIAGEAEHRPLTEKEAEFVKIAEYHIDKFKRDGEYQDRAGYLAREQAEIDHIRKISKDANIMKGEYNP
ncbi:hypothetical protein KY348_02010 [Candidatus Woesearchaeota archaeon]|nr:hypothetical protein [Candidatus Woesearchaeota archaeon]